MSLNTCSSLIKCCRSGDEEDIKHFIAHYKFSDHPELLDGYLLVCEAVKHDNISVAKLLLQCDAKVRLDKNETSTSDTPLHLAASRKSVEIVQLLLDKGVDVNIKNKHQKTPLHNAIEQQSEEIVKLLLEKGADPEIRHHDLTPLHLATKNQNFEIIQHLLNHKADIHSHCEKTTALSLAVETNRIDIVKLLVQNGAMDRLDSASYYSLLFLAVAQNNHNLLLLLLESRNEKLADVCSENITSSEDKVNFNNLLHIAAMDGKQEIIAALVKFNFDLNSKDKFGKTPVYYAYCHHNLDICKYLLANGWCIDAKVDRNFNLLHVSVISNDAEFVKYLLENGADVNATTIDNSTSLHLACSNQCERIVKLLLKFKINIHVANIEGSTCLHGAAKTGNEQILSRLIRKGANLNAMDNNGKTAICYAAEWNHLNAVRFFLDKNPDPCDVNNKLAFCSAILCAGYENRNIIELFLIRRFRVKSGSFDDIHIPEPYYSQFASKYNQPMYETVFKDLLKCSPSIRAFLEYQILLRSVKNGFITMVQDLLKTDANVNALLEGELTLLEIATKNGQDTIMKEIVKMGANLDVTDNEGNSLLHIGVVNGCVDSVEFLLKFNVNVEARNKEGETALHLVADHNSELSIFKLLLNAGADINAKTTKYGETVLHKAVVSGKAFLVKFLLGYDPDVNVKNIHNRTPLDMAISWRKIKIVFVLLEHGAISSRPLLYGTDKISEAITTHSIKTQLLTKSALVTEAELYIDFVSKCTEEISRMIHCQIGHKISLYDLLTKRESQVELYMRNEKILEFVDSIDLEKSYPVYYRLLNVRINKVKRKNFLMELGSRSLVKLTKTEIPYLVAENIFSYVSNVDLRKLISASVNCK